MTRRQRPLSFVPAVLMAAALAGGARADGVVLTVNFADDLPDEFTNDSKADAASTLPGEQISLRAAVMLANKLEGPDTIIVPDGLWKLTLKGEDEDGAETGDLDVTDDLLIIGTAPEPDEKNDGSIVDGKKLKDRLFEVSAGVTLTLQGLTLRHGRAPKDESGGAARVEGALVLQQVEVRTCKAPADGGAIDVAPGAAGLTLEDVLFFKNSTDGDGGAIDLDGGVAQVSRATFQKNHADGEGGGLEVTGAIASLTNVTFSANSAGQDGGAMSLEGGGVLTLVNVTSYANACKETAGLSAIDGGGSNNTAMLRNALLDDKGDRNASGTLISLGGNVDSGTSCNFPADDLSDVKTKLLKLKHYGGFTPTHALAETSPAIDAGSDPGCPATDQRGVARVDIEDIGGLFVLCDAGAFEYTAP